ncbi:MAG: hypothetical protein COB77_04195 [Gammaproteobacteria bacterium]|nr:MAG: hypothetical protein COB77_04195 [Gammaproteobacteria bacterium]
MKNATINRRQFIASILAAGITPKLLASQVSAYSNEYLVSAQGIDANHYSITSVNQSANSIQTALTQFRGHGLAQNPAKPDSIILFARRPGRQGIELSLSTGEIKHTFDHANNRNLQGHGCFSADGKLLFTAETDSITGEGKIAIRDTQDYKQLSEIDSYGIGPHEIKLMPDGKTLVVANGGIHTRPESGRKKLNLQSMQSSLVYIDLASAKKLDTFQVAEPKASIRHLDVANDGTVALAMQVQREATNHYDIVPLAAIHKPNKTILLLEKPSIVIEKLHDYLGSVAINNASRIAGFTSPKGNLVAFWNIDNGEFSGYHQFNDVCGLCISQDQQHFIISNSLGKLRQLDAFTLKENKATRLHFKHMRWDNHMINVST